MFSLYNIFNFTNIISFIILNIINSTNLFIKKFTRWHSLIKQSINISIMHSRSSIINYLRHIRIIAGGGGASLLKTEGESSAELDGSSLPPLVVEGKILVLVSFKFLIVISRYKSQVTQRIELCSPTTAPEKGLDNPQVYGIVTVFKGREFNPNL